MGFLDRIGFGKLKDGLAKTRETFVGKITGLVTGRAKLDDETFDSLEEILIGADVGAGLAAQVIDGLRERLRTWRGDGTPDVIAMLKEEMSTQFGSGRNEDGTDPFVIPAKRPYIVLVVGINGVGKTTTIGKLANVYRTAGKKVVIAAADTFRAAANEQLEIWAERAGAEIIRQNQGSDPAAVAFDAVSAAKAREADIVIIDTAGRLHTKINLMEELKKISRVIQKVVPDAPHEVLLVIDASTGQNGLQQAKQFAASVGITGLVVTKLDGTAKGGIVFAISRDMNIPVKFIGVGEKIDDLQPFDRMSFIDALFSRS